MAPKFHPALQGPSTLKLNLTVSSYPRFSV